VTVQLGARARGLPRPAAALLLSPFADLEATGESYDAGTDPLFTREFCRSLASGFLGEGVGLRDPRVNLLYADLAGLSPLCIQAGGAEALLDDARSLEEHARKAGLDVRLDVFPGMLHTFQMAAGRAPEADDAIARLAGWVRPRLGL
jgi:acetyl esterase/lipase